MDELSKNHSTSVSSHSVLRGDRVVLRAPRESDKADRLAYRRNAEFRKMVGGDPTTLHTLTVADVEKWFEGASADPLNWIVEAAGRCVGTARLNKHDTENRRARYTIGIFDPDLWGQGYGTEVTRLVLAYGFDILCLHRIDLRVLAFNSRAIACYEKCGFVREGLEREGSWIGGEWQSDIWMSILEQEYRRTVPASSKE